MRHPHGLRAAAAAGLPAVGAAYEGGFFAGAISHTANGVATHLLIVAPAASGYNGQVALQSKTADTFTAGVDSVFNGSANSANMNNASHPAAQYCEGLTIGGYSDWYLPARYEIDIAYYNLKPTTVSNTTFATTNPYSVPERTVNNTAGDPAQTSIAAFQTGGAQAFVADYHWTSTSTIDDRTRYRSFDNGGGGNENKSSSMYVRAFRKVAV